MAVQKRPRAREKSAGQGKMRGQNTRPVGGGHRQGVKHRHVLRRKGSAEVQGTFLFNPRLDAKKRNQMVTQKPGPGGSGHIIAASRSHMQKSKHAQELFGEIGNPWPRVRPVDGLQGRQPVVRIMQRKNTTRRSAGKKIRALQIEIHTVPVGCDGIRQADLPLGKGAEEDDGQDLIQRRPEDGDECRIIGRFGDTDQIDVREGICRSRGVTAGQEKAKTARVVRQRRCDLSKKWGVIHGQVLGSGGVACNYRAKPGASFRAGPGPISAE